MKCEWKYSTIGEACLLVTDGSHFSPKSVSDGQYMVSVKDFTAYGFDFSNCRQINDEDYQRLEKAGCVPEYEDVLVGKDGARYFEDIIVYRQSERPALLSSIAILRCDTKEILPDYLYYLMKDPTFKQDIRDNYGSGSAIPRIILKDFKRMPIKYPCIGKQERIISILRSLDDKIELNNKINENLEQQAQALFDKLMFVSDNTECRVSDIAYLNPKRPLSKNKMARCIDMSQLSTTGAFPSGWEMKPFTGGMRFVNGDTLLARITPCLENGKTAFIDFLNENEVAFGSTEYIVLAPKEGVPSEFLYCLARYPAFVDYAVKNMNGSSGRQRVSAETIGQFALPEISKSDLSAFAENVVPMFKEMRCNFFENLRLAEIRDALLPKLMNGEIDIDGI